MAFFIKHATVDDAEIVHRLVQAAFAEYRGTIPVPPGALSDTLDDTRRIVAEGRTLLVFDGSFADALVSGPFNGALDDIFRSARPVGTVRYEARPEYLYVGRLAVIPEWRGRGVGRLLMQEMERIAPSLGLTRIRLGTRESMPSNIAFYEKLGYEIVEREPHPRGQDVNLWFEKVLAGSGVPLL